MGEGSVERSDALVVAVAQQCNAVTRIGDGIDHGERLIPQLDHQVHLAIGNPRASGADVDQYTTAFRKYRRKQLPFSHAVTSVP